MQSSSSGLATMTQLLLLLLIIIPRGVLGYRWETAAGFSTVEQFTSERDCERLKFLTHQQRKICQRHLDFMEAVREGAREALDECKYQFRNSRWNCSTFDSKDSFGGVMKTGSKETAFVYSIMSAGVTQSVARACSSGRLKKCGCDRTLSGMSGEGFEWTGCSDNVAYGSAFALKFLDSREHLRKKSLIPRALMNLHNNNIGRKAVEKNMRIQCKCHGVSGSCEVKTCWKTLPDFRTVGDELRSKYDKSTRVMVARDGSHTELIPANDYNDHEIDVKIRKVENKNKNNNNQRDKNKMDRRKSNNKGKKSDPTTTTVSVFIDKLTTTTSTTSTPLTNTSTTTTNFTKISEIEKYGATSPKPYKVSRFKRWVDDENQQKQKKNKVWISHGRDSVPRKHDIGNNDNKVKKGGNRVDKTKSETQQPRNQELGRFPRVPVESKKDKTSQQSQNRRYREEMEQRRQLQRKRRERKIRRQRQQYEDELRLSESTTPLYDDQHNSKRRQEGNHHPSKSNNNHHASNQDINRYHYMPKTTFYHNKSSHSKEDEDSFDHQMVFLDLSPDYCNSDKQTGSLGTQGRTCSIDGTDGNCSTLCCGRGYSVRRSVVTERCHCRFQWCCEVKCMKCRREVVEYTCR